MTNEEFEARWARIDAIAQARFLGRGQHEGVAARLSLAEATELETAREAQRAEEIKAGMVDLYLALDATHPVRGAT